VFQGEFDHSVDDKGRVIIPSRFRNLLGERFYLTKGLDHCIFVYTEAEFKIMSEKLAAQRQLDEKTIRLQRFFTSTESSVDNQGRVALPLKLRKYAGIEETSEVTLVGTGNRIEIWESNAWIAYNDDLTDDVISEAAREVGLA